MKYLYDTIKNLNNIYIPLIESSKKCQELLTISKQCFKTLWANNHYQRHNGEFICEAYPIPIVEIKNIGDIGFNVSGCFYEGYFDKRKLLEFDLTLLDDIENFVLYGEKSFLKDIYNSQMKIMNIKQAIESSKEEKIAINFTFELNKLENVLDLLIRLTKSIN